MKLADIAYARSGDKGNDSNIGVMAKTPEDYAWLLEHLTAECVQSHFKPLGATSTIRYEIPNLLALNFVIHDVLAGGGSRSLHIDAQGKALGQVLLQLQIG